MHDLILAKEILNKVLKLAKKNKLKKISKIVIDLGKIVKHSQEIRPESLKYNFKLFAKNTIAEKAKLLIKKIKSKNWSLKGIKSK